MKRWLPILALLFTGLIALIGYEIYLSSLHRAPVRAAETFVRTLGNYDPASDAAYVENVHRLATDSFYRDFLTGPFLKARGFNQQFHISESTTVLNSALISYQGSSATVRVTASVTDTSPDGESTVQKNDTVTLHNEAGTWKVSGIQESVAGSG